MEVFILIFVALAGLIFSISVHESAHALMADRLGDPTAKSLGRISLNPADHIDPVGTVLFPLMALILGLPVIGWAKPTPFNPWNLKNPRRDSALISLAGPASNFLIAIICSLFFRFGLLPLISPFSTSNSAALFFSLNSVEKTGFLISGLLILNVMLGVFNLIPIHPLDGFKVVGGLLPKTLYYQWVQLERIGPLLLLALVFFGGNFLGAIIYPVLNFILRILVG